MPIAAFLKNECHTLQFTAGAVFAVLLFIGSPTPSNAQITTAVERGIPANSSFSGGDIDTVNLQNGNLHISIPILSSKQRGGGTLTWSLLFDTQTWIKQYYKYVYPHCGSGLASVQDGVASPSGIGGGGGTCNPPGFYIGSPEQGIVAGWRLSSPFNWQVVSNNPNLTAPGSTPIPCGSNPNILYTPITNWAVVDPSGTRHPLPLYQELDTPTGSHCYPATVQGPTLDGSGMYFNSQTGLLALKNGTQIQMTQGTGPNIFQYTGSTLLDTNGNEAGPNDTMNRAMVTTTAGSTIQYTSPLGGHLSGPSYTRYAVLDSNGDQQVYQVNYELIDITPDVCSQDPPFVQGSDPCSLGSYSNLSLVPSELILPNEKAYLFNYYNNSTGEIQQITLPTGATIGYTYTDDYQAKFAAAGQPFNAVGARGVASRTVTVNGVASTWTYSITIAGNATVTDPVGNVAVHNYGKLCVKNGSICTANVYENSAAYSNASGNLLRTVAKTYAEEYDPVDNSVANARVISETTTLENGQESQTQTTYDTFAYSCNSSGCPGTATRSNPTEVRDYDFGQGAPGALLRRIDTTYQSFSIGGATITKPQSVTEYGGSGTQAASTTYEYDNYSHPSQPLQSSGAVQHSSSYGTGYTNRANVTATEHWRNSDGRMLTSTNQYDDAGNILSTVDPKGYITSYDYTDSWSNGACGPSGQGKLYLTKTTNAAGQITRSTFDSCTGKVASTTDSNNQTTSLTYDLLDRVKQVTRQDGGLTTYCYSDDPNGFCASSGAWSASETEKISSSVNIVHTNIFDGLGRTINSQLADPVEGVVTTGTVYDLLGRVSKVSNPYRSGDTVYWTANAYDGLSRIISVTRPDGSIAFTTYSGNTTTINDEAGKKRESVSDGLGRLTTVFEDPAGLNYETDYSYDVLGSLLMVNQKGGSTNSANWRTRTFAYNSLGELLCSANPEITSPLSSPATCPNPDSGTYTPGTVRYQYDDDGNVTSRIAPAENQQGTATVTTTYNYDTLNRLKGKSYSDGTASIAYGYDGVAPSGCTLPTPNPAATNVVGRMSGMCDGSGATAWSYDGMGRILTEARKIATASDQISYTYYYNSAVNTVTYPKAGASAALTLTYGINASGRVTSVANGTTVYEQIQSTWASGAPRTYLYGANIQLSDTYNAQLQPLTLTATQISPSNTLFSKTYDFHAGSSDNGDLWAVTDGLDSLGLNRPHGSVNYTYDAMNRASSAQTLGTDCTSVNGGTRDWGESFSIDPWGNLTGKTVTKCSADSLSSSASTTNQLTAALYDSAGNATQNNGISLAYDAEGHVVTAAGVSYAYDGEGQRVEKPGKLYWRGGGADALAETSATDTNPIQYIFFNGRRIARLDPGASTPKYYVSDNVGSTELVTDYLGNMLSESLFFPYGWEQQVLTNDTNTYKFSGKERDSESGLDNFGARYYASNLGRFMSPDWDAKPTAVPYASFGDPQTLNLYAYVENAPLNRVDADGHTPAQTLANMWTEPCPGNWGEECIEAWHQKSLGSDSFTGDPQANLQADMAKYDAMVADAQAQSDANQAQTGSAQQQTAPAPAGSDPTVNLNFNGTPVTVSYTYGPMPNSPYEGGVDITATPSGCDGCQWSQVYSRTGTGAAPPTKDGPGVGPLYGQEGGPASQFKDRPASTNGAVGTFTGTAILGNTNIRGKSFSAVGAMTYSYSVNGKGGVTMPITPRLATPSEFRMAIRVLQTNSPDWQIHLEGKERQNENALSQWSCVRTSAGRLSSLPGGLRAVGSSP